MEHIVQFAIGIDDDAIRKRVAESGYNDIITALSKECKEELARNGFCSRYGKSVDWKYFVECSLANWIDQHKDEVIEAAAKLMCDAYKRTKVFKEKMAEAME